MSELRVICITRVRDEAWILDRFLKCASQWADQIIVADQGSTDGSLEIARRYGKVRLIEKPAKEYSDAHRHALLIEEARKIPGNRVMVALDADEALTANWQTSPEWASLLSSPPGTVVAFNWINVLPGMTAGSIPLLDLHLAYVDDGAPYKGSQIHSRRVPTPHHERTLSLMDIKVLHYKFADPARFRSKDRWYQCFETVSGRRLRPLQIYRQYHEDHQIPPQTIVQLRPEWLAGYVAEGIDMSSVQVDGRYWWDEEVLRMLLQYGPDRFKRLDIWDKDWRSHPGGGELSNSVALSDPRGALCKAVHRWLGRTQGRPRTIWIRCVEKLLRTTGW